MVAYLCKGGGGGELMYLEADQMIPVDFKDFDFMDLVNVKLTHPCVFPALSFLLPPANQIEVQPFKVFIRRAEERRGKKCHIDFFFPLALIIFHFVSELIFQQQHDRLYSFFFFILQC